MKQVSDLKHEAIMAEGFYEECLILKDIVVKAGKVQ